MPELVENFLKESSRSRRFAIQVSSNYKDLVKTNQDLITAITSTLDFIASNLEKYFNFFKKNREVHILSLKINRLVGLKSSLNKLDKRGIRGLADDGMKSKLATILNIDAKDDFESITITPVYLLINDYLSGKLTFRAFREKVQAVVDQQIKALLSANSKHTKSLADQINNWSDNTQLARSLMAKKIDSAFQGSSIDFLSIYIESRAYDYFFIQENNELKIVPNFRKYGNFSTDQRKRLEIFFEENFSGSQSNELGLDNIIKIIDLDLILNKTLAERALEILKSELLQEEKKLKLETDYMRGKKFSEHANYIAETLPSEPLKQNVLSSGEIELLRYFFYKNDGKDLLADENTDPLVDQKYLGQTALPKIKTLTSHNMTTLLDQVKIKLGLTQAEIEELKTKLSNLLVTDKATVEDHTNNNKIIEIKKTLQDLKKDQTKYDTNKENEAVDRLAKRILTMIYGTTVPIQITKIAPSIINKIYTNVTATIPIEYKVSAKDIFRANYELFIDLAQGNKLEQYLDSLSKACKILDHSYPLQEIIDVLSHPVKLQSLLVNEQEIQRVEQEFNYYASLLADQKTTGRIELLALMTGLYRGGRLFIGGHTMAVKYFSKNATHYIPTLIGKEKLLTRALNKLIRVSLIIESRAGDVISIANSHSNNNFKQLLKWVIDHPVSRYDFEVVGNDRNLTVKISKRS